MRISRRQFAWGIVGAATFGSAMGRPPVLMERRVYAHGSALPPLGMLRRNGIHPRSMARTEDGTVYLIPFDTLEVRVKAWDRFNVDEDWCALRDAGSVALKEVQVYPAGKIFEMSL